MSLVIKNARLRKDYKLHNVYIQNGIINSIDGKKSKVEEEIDARGLLLTESFVIAHLHLDKVYTYSDSSKNATAKYQEGKDSVSAIKEASKVKENMNERAIYKRAETTLRHAFRFGVCGIRAFADVDDVIGLKAIRALLRLKKEFAKQIELQVVAFPQEGVVNVSGVEELIEKAIEEGADVVGGIPWIEHSNQERKKHIEKMLDIAVKYDRDVAMLVDDCCSGSSKTLEMLAREVVKRKWIGRVVACHARSMQFYSKAYLRYVVQLCKRAGISFVVNPHTGPCNAPVKTLVDNNITVALGQDDCADAYYPFGRCKMTEVAFLASHILRMMLPQHFELLYDMITVNPAKMIGMEDFGIKMGSRARLLLLPVKNVYEAIWYQAEPVAILVGEKVLKQSIQ